MIRSVMTTSVVLCLMVVAGVSADGPVSDSAELSLRGVVRSRTDISIDSLTTDSGARISAQTSAPAGCSLSLEMHSSLAQHGGAGLEVNAHHVSVVDGRAHLANLRSGAESADSIHIAWHAPDGGAVSGTMVLDVAVW